MSNEEIKTEAEVTPAKASPKESLKKDIDNGKFAVKATKSFEQHEDEQAVKNIALMGSRTLALQLESKRVPDAFKKLCKAELDKRVAAREAKAKKAE